MISTGMPSLAKVRAEKADNCLPCRGGSRFTSDASNDDRNSPPPEGAVEIIDVSEEDKEEDGAILKSRLTAYSWGCGDSNWVTLALYPSHIAT